MIVNDDDDDYNNSNGIEIDIRLNLILYFFKTLIKISIDDIIIYTFHLLPIFIFLNS